MSGESYVAGPIRFSYGDQPVCLDLPNLEIQKSRVTVIAGENGSGKTTLLKVLAGLLLPDANTDGHLVELQRDAVYLHQTPYLFKGTVGRNLSLACEPGRSNSHRGHVRSVVAQALETVGLHGFINRKTRTLSGGEAKRVALARVFLSDRPILLLDEPAAHADEKSVRLIEDACARYAESGRTLVIATHRGGFAYRVADLLYDLREGRLRPSTINILRGEVVRRDAGFLQFRSRAAEFRVPERDGEFGVALVRGEDILLSRDPFSSSARNSLGGELMSLQPQPDGTVHARIDCGAELVSVVTPSAVADLGLSVGDRVFATFKASSIGTY